MAIITRYFSTAAAGAGNGTTWADRAALFSGVWSTVITAFPFTAGSDGLQCLIEGGLNYAVSAGLLSATFTAGVPTAAKPLIFHGCDSLGVPLTVPDLTWTADQPGWDDSSLPILTASVGGGVSAQISLISRLIAFRSHASGTASALVRGGLLFDWCTGINAHSHASAAVFGDTSGSVARITNCWTKCTGTSFAQVIRTGATPIIDNLRIEGNTAAASGGRVGLFIGTNGSNTGQVTRVCAVGCLNGIAWTSSNTNSSVTVTSSVVVNATGDGIFCHNTASPIGFSTIERTVVANCGLAGINGGTSTVLVTNCRMRDNTGGNFTNAGNYPTDLGNYTTDSDDATEFVDAAGGDYRIKAGSAIHGMGFGVSDEPASGGGTIVRRFVA